MKHVVAIAELADLEEVAAEQADDGPVGAAAELSGARAESVGIDRSRRAGDGRPHGLIERCADGPRTAVLRQREIGLLEVQGPVGHLGEDPAVLGPDHPALRLSLDLGPGGHEAGRAVRQRPVRPIARTQGKTASHLDRIDAEPVEHVLAHDGQLLDDIVDIDRLGRQAQGPPQLRIGQGGDAGGTVPGKVYGDARGLAMAQRG